MAYCPNCGKELKPGDRFCRSCGTDTGAAPNIPYPADNPKMSSRNGREISNSIIITGIICATAVLLVILILLFLSISEKPSKHSDDRQISLETQPSSETESPSLETETPSSTISETEAAAQDTHAAALESGIPLKEWPERETLPFSAKTFYIELPGYWAEHYNSESGANYYSFYNIENADAGYGGFLFSIQMYGADGEWEYLPSYRFLGEKDGIYYVAAFPTDVQFDIDNEENTNLYHKMQEDIDTILETFTMK
ncbi:zinc ribbon domain-containing protein [Lachnospiraceae bacterium 46-15]